MKNICQDFNWEVRREICSQLPYISQYLGAQKAFEHFYPELTELLDDEEREVVTTAIVSFSEFIDQFFGPPADEATAHPIADLETVRTQMSSQLKKLLSSENFTNKEPISRLMLERCFHMAAQLNTPEDQALQQQLASLLQSWMPGA